MIYVEDADSFAGALAALDLNAIEVVSYRGNTATSYDSLTRTAASRGVGGGFGNTGPETIAKILFTSGSTGKPKGVINTHRMLCSNQKSLQLLWPFLAEEPPVVVDWLPWHHTFGGNHNFNMVLSNGGSLYIDDGKPRPGALDATIENLKSVPPTLYFNVPLGMELIIDRLEQDAALRRCFFSRLKLIVCAGAALPHNATPAGDCGEGRPRGNPCSVELGIDRDSAAVHIHPLPGSGAQPSGVARAGRGSQARSL